MTVREKLQSMLVNKGMFESQAKEVMDIAEPELNKLDNDYKITFHSPADEYPSVIYTILFMAIRPIALNWIEENIPMAWYKPMFL
jgi:hypothetical protein